MARVSFFYKTPLLSSSYRHWHTHLASARLSRHFDYLLKQIKKKDLVKMQNEEGQNMDLYIPRKCSATNRLITSKDHASVQINVGYLDEHGIYNGRFSTFALSGFVRAQGDVDSALDRLWQKKKVEVRQQ